MRVFSKLIQQTAPHDSLLCIRSLLHLSFEVRDFIVLNY